MIIALTLLASAITSVNVPRAIEPSPTAAPPVAADRAARPAQRYCVVSTPTGTRIPQRDCRTRAEWLRDGYDPTAKD